MLILAKFSRDKAAVLGASIVLFALIIALLAPLIAPYPGDIAASLAASRVHLRQVRRTGVQACLSQHARSGDIT